MACAPSRASYVLLEIKEVRNQSATRTYSAEYSIAEAQRAVLLSQNFFGPFVNTESFLVGGRRRRRQPQPILHFLEHPPVFKWGWFSEQFQICCEFHSQFRIFLLIIAKLFLSIMQNLWKNYSILIMMQIEKWGHHIMSYRGWAVCRVFFPTYIYASIS